MQGFFFHCRLCIPKVLYSGVHPKVLDFAMSEMPSSSDQLSRSRGLALYSSEPTTPVVKCSDPDFSSWQSALQSELWRMLTSECNGEQLKFSSRERRSFSEDFRKLFLTRENARTFQRCRSLGEQKKKADSSIPPGISLAFLCWPRYAWSNPHHQEPIVILYFSSEVAHSITSKSLTTHNISNQFL